MTQLICEMIVKPEIQHVDKLAQTQRAEGGFGSTNEQPVVRMALLKKQYILQIFYHQNRTKSILRIELCAHDYYPKNRLTKCSSILKIESYYTRLFTCLHHFVLYIQVIIITINTNI